MSQANQSIRDGFNSRAYEPVAQTFYGFRAFKVHTDGLPMRGPAESHVVDGAPDGDAPLRGGLRGVFKSNYQWGADANHALCLRSARPLAVSRVQGKAHSLMLPECDCGFWAYTNGAHVLAVSGPAVLGIIEGWGRCVLGPHGFRAEKARIVALAFPAAEDAGSLIDSAEANIKDSLSQAIHTLSTAFVSMVGAMNGLRWLSRSVAPPPQLLIPPTRAKRPWEDVDVELAADIQRAYPHARVFRTLEAMHRAYPLSDLSALLPQDAAQGEGVGA